MLTFMEVVLGVDNIVFISIVSNRLPKEDQAKARNIGLVLAMILRIILLFGIQIIMQMTKPIIEFDLFGHHAGITGQSLILFLGGLFLLYKSVTEIHHKLEGDPEAYEEKGGAKAKLSQVIVQITLLNIVFSFDSILTAVGMTKGIPGDPMPVMIISVILSMLIMMAFAGPVGRFINEHPTVQMLGLSFLILIGFMLIAEAAHASHLIAESVPKGYLYFAIFFSLLVEVLNIRLRKKQPPIQLRGITQEAKEDGVL
jgi:predicted tellurium resistance membrane protein TerC